MFVPYRLCDGGERSIHRSFGIVGHIGLLSSIIARRAALAFVDSATVREEVKKKYRDVAIKPNKRDRFPLVEPWLPFGLLTARRRARCLTRPWLLCRCGRAIRCLI